MTEKKLQTKFPAQIRFHIFKLVRVFLITLPCNLIQSELLSSTTRYLQRLKILIFWQKPFCT